MIAIYQSEMNGHVVCLFVCFSSNTTVPKTSPPEFSIPRVRRKISAIIERLERLRLAFTANGRSDHVIVISPRLPLTIYRFLVKVSSFVLAINIRIIFHHSRIRIIYFEET